MKVNQVVYGSLWLLLLLPFSVLAQLKIEIVKTDAAATPIAVVPFAWRSQEPEPETNIAEVIAADLYRTGLFQPLDPKLMAERPSDASDIRFGTWRLQKVDYLLIGEVQDTPDRVSYDLQYQLFDVNTGERVATGFKAARLGELRLGAHRVADAIYEKLIGVPGAFATRIAYITAQGLGSNQVYRLYVADSDGENAYEVARNSEPFLSPAWSPDGKQLAYVSFEKGNSAIYMQDIFTGSRELISGAKGINGSPAFSPDGTRLAMTLSKSGNPEIYVLDLLTKQLKQLTRHWAIDTEPAWSPDARYLYFTSDRGGRPQIYRVPATGGDVQRITNQGEYNTRASISPNRKEIAVANGKGNQYRIAVYDLDADRLTVLTPGSLDESPSFAPNGSMILYATREGRRGVLSAVSRDGGVRQRIVLAEGDVREPTWSPVIED